MNNAPSSTKPVYNLYAYYDVRNVTLMALRPMLFYKKILIIIIIQLSNYVYTNLVSCIIRFLVNCSYVYLLYCKTIKKNLFMFKYIIALFSLTEYCNSTMWLEDMHI